jgi:hypothetical protein
MEPPVLIGGSRKSRTKIEIRVNTSIPPQMTDLAFLRQYFDFCGAVLRRIKSSCQRPGAGRRQNAIPTLVVIWEKVNDPSKT